MDVRDNALDVGVGYGVVEAVESEAALRLELPDILRPMAGTCASALAAVSPGSLLKCNDSSA